MKGRLNGELPQQKSPGVFWLELRRGPLPSPGGSPDLEEKL